MTLASRFTARIAALSLAAGALVALQPAVPAFAVDPVAGGLTAAPADSLFPNQGNSGYDATHYDIDFRVDVTTATTSAAVGTTNLPNATATIDAVTTGAPLSSYSFDFQGSTSTLANATLNVQSVTVNGQPATFSRIETTTTSNATTDVHKLIVTPATPVDGAFTTVVTYSGRPVAHTDTDGSSEGWNNTTDGATFLNQPVGAMTLFPNNNTPRDKATYTFTINAPTTLKSSNYAAAGGKPYQAGVVSNGELVSRTPSGDGTRTTWVWNQAKQMASELTLVSVGRYDIYTSDITLASGRTIPEWTFIDPAISIANQTTTLGTRAQLKSIIDFFETKYGPYPGNSTGLVTDVVPSAINYALETQDRSFFPNAASRGTTYHEVMHQWWGDAVAPTDWNDISLNEGPAQYSEFQFPYEGAGSTTVTTETANFNLWNGLAANAAAFAVAPAQMTQASQLFGNQSYQKGSMALEALRTSIGAGTFETLMRQYQLTYTGGQISGRRVQAFKAMAESLSGRDLTTFFNTWYYTAGRPAWPVKYNVNLAGPNQVNPDDIYEYTLTVRNTGKVAMAAGNAVVTVDLADVMDNGIIGNLPSGSTLDGTTLTWNVPATPLGATTTGTIPVYISQGTAPGSTLFVTESITTLGGTCLTCTSSVTVGTAPLSPAPVPTITGLVGGAPVVGTTLTASTSGWAARTGTVAKRRATSFTYQWMIDGTPVPGATASTWTPTGDVAGLAVTVRVTGTQAGSNPTTQTSAPTAPGVRATQPVATPTISGTPKVGLPLSVNPGTGWAPGTVFTYVWAANGAPITGATGPTYVPAVATQVGQTLTVAVAGTKFGYTTVTRTSAATAAVAAPDPLVSPVPVIGVTPKVGVPVVPDYGSWDDNSALTFTWAANGTTIGGATSGAYTPIAAQVGQTLTVTVTGTKGGYTAVTRTSAPSVAVEPGTQVLQPTPTITGTPRPGTVSTGVPGTWDTGTILTYKWYADGVVIPGATTLTYTPTTAQIGQLLTFEVTSTRAGYTTVVKSSVGKTVIGTQTLTPTPTITGTPQVGVALTAVPGTWDDGTVFTYQWSVAGTPVAGATGTTYTPVADDLGKTVTVAVTGTRSSYDPVTRTSAPTAPVLGTIVTQTAPAISGTPTVGSVLTATPGTYDPSDVAATYQWFANGSKIDGATSSTYTPTSAQDGQLVVVRVIVAKPGYADLTAVSASVRIVTTTISNQSPPVISGSPTVGSTLTLSTGTWNFPDLTYSYVWYANGVAIRGANRSTYVVASSVVGKTLTGRVTATRPGSDAVTATSNSVNVS